MNRSLPGGGQGAQQNPYLPLDKKNSFGRTDVVRDTDGTRGVELARVDVDDVQSWTVTFDVKQYLAGTVVLGHLEYGAGNATSQLDLDVSDHLDVPVTGDHVRAWVTVVTKIGSPAGALVSAAISAEVLGFGWPDRELVIGTDLAGAASSAVLAVACRLVRVHAYSTQASGGTMLYLMLFDGVAVPANGTVPVSAYALPPAVNVDVTYAGSRPFSQGLVWAVSSSPGVLTLSPDTAMVELELARAPLGRVATALQGTG